MSESSSRNSMSMIANSANRSLIAGLTLVRSGLRLCTPIHHILRAIVGQVFNLRRIVNPPAALVRARHAPGESPPPLSALPLCGPGWYPARAPEGTPVNRRWSACLQAIRAACQPAPQFLPDSRFREKYVALSASPCRPILPARARPIFPPRARPVFPSRDRQGAIGQVLS